MPMSHDNHINIFEVAPRDGLQNISTPIPTDIKIAMIDQLSQCGYKHIEVASFVNPNLVPQMADAEKVLSGINRIAGTSYSALTPNLSGYHKATAANATEVAIFASASESFSQKNINCSITESLERFAPILKNATSNNIPVRGYVSCVAGCPYEGAVYASAVAQLTEQLLSLGCYEVSLGDTIGIGTPKTISTVLGAVLEVAPPEKLAGHYHDTNGNALDNITLSIERGLRTFDASVGGLGGCPFAQGSKGGSKGVSKGNVDTIAVIEMLHSQGFTTGIDLNKLRKIANQLNTLLTSQS